MVSANNPIINIHPAKIAISIPRPPSFRLVIPSIININRYPPSKTGNGNKFITPKLTDSNAIIDNNATNPIANAWPETSAIVINDPSCFDERSPVTICFSTTNNVFD